MLTAVQREMLDFIRDFQRERGGVSPSVSEIARGMKYRSKASVHSVLRQLEDRGAIDRLHNRDRAIRILDGVVLAWVRGPGKRRRRYRLVWHG